jgi:hypothetical protein
MKEVKVIVDTSMSLGGFVTGPDLRVGEEA